MQLLLTEPAHARVKDRLPKGVEVVELSAEGVLSPADAQPEAAWFSIDLFTGGPARAFFQAVLASPNAKWLQSFSAGIDNPAFKAVMQKGVRVTRSDAQGPAIAEYVMAHALHHLHPIAAHAEQQRAHTWRRLAFREVADTRWVIVGFGSLGRNICERLRPFGAHITVVRRNAGADPLADAVIAQADLPRALAEADVVVLACPLNDETRDMADAAFFQAIKPGGLFINVGRGELVDEDALKAALDSGALSHAVLDVFRTEPLLEDAWFWGHPKVTVTPHDSPTGSGLQRRGDALFLENLNRYLAGEPLRNEAQPHEVGL